MINICYNCTEIRGDNLKKKDNIILIGFIFLIMISIALAENFRGIFIPEFKLQFAISDTDIGIIDSMGTLGYLVFTFIGSILCQKLGQKKVFIAGLIVMVISMLMYFGTNTAGMLYINIFVLNIGLAFTSIAINTVIPVLAVGFQAVLMNATHFCYGIGASSASYIGGTLLENGYSWNNIYFVVGIFFVMLLMIFLFVKVPNVSKSEYIGKKEIYISKRNNAIMVMLILGLGFYVFAEISTGTWFINYLTENLSMSPKTSSSYMSLFFMMLTIGRLTGGFIVEKIGYLKCILIYLVIAFLLYLSGIIIGNNAIILVSISGFFFSIVYPTALLCIGKIFESNSAGAIGIVVTFSSLVRMMLSAIFGKINDILGTTMAFYIIPICLIVSFIFMVGVYIMTKEKFGLIKEK